MKKKLFIAFLLLLLVLVGALFAGQAWLTARFEREAVIAQMEQWWDCRAELESSSINLFASPATVELRGLKLALSDDQVGKPLHQRDPFKDEYALVTTREVTLAVTLQHLFSRRYNIEKLLLEDVVIRTVIDTEGDSSLDYMFDSPELEEEAGRASEVSSTPQTNRGTVSVSSLLTSRALAAQLSAASDKASVTTSSEADNSLLLPKHKAKKRKKEKKPKKPFKAGDLGLALKVREAAARNASFEVIDYKNLTHLKLEQVHLAIKDIDIDPNNLASHNLCKVEFSGNLINSKLDTNDMVANFSVLGNGVWQPFHPQTGEWFPDLGLDITVKKDGLLGGIPLEGQLKAKDQKKLAEYGLDLSGLAMGGQLQKDLVTHIHAIGSKLIIKKDTELAFPDYTITLLSQSWLNGAEDTHRFNARITASEELSERVLSGAEAKLAEKYGDTLAAIAQVTVNTAFMDEQKRLIIPIRSKGALSKPEISLDGSFADIKDTLKSTGKSLLESLLKN